MKRLLFTAVISLFIVGCATQAVKLSDAKDVERDRVYLEDVTGNDTATITIIRDSGLMGKMCGARIYLDGKLAAMLESYEKVTFKIDSGEHIIGMNTQGSGLCSFGPDLEESSFNIKPKEIRYFRASVDTGGMPSVTPTTQVY